MILLDVSKINIAFTVVSSLLKTN